MAEFEAELTHLFYPETRRSRENLSLQTVRFVVKPEMSNRTDLILRIPDFYLVISE